MWIPSSIRLFLFRFASLFYHSVFHLNEINSVISDHFFGFDFIFAEHLQQLFDVIAPARLEGQIDLDSADLQVAEGAVVGDFEDVCADGSRMLADAGQFARPIAAENADAHHAAVLGKAALDDLREQVRIDISAADDHRDVLALDPRYLVEKDGGQWGGAAAFDHGLFDFEQFEDRAGDLVFADGDDVVDVAPRDFGCEFAGAFDRQAVGDGRLRGDLQNLADAQSRFQAGVVLGFDADDADIGAFFLNCDGGAADQPASAHRHHDGVELHVFFEQFQADRSLPRDDGFIVEGMNERHPPFRRDVSSMSERLVIIRAVQHDLAAQVARVHDLDQRRGPGHDDGRFNSEPRRVIGHALRVIARAGGDDAGPFFGLAQLQKFVERAALFETLGHLQVFELEIGLASAQPAQRQ